MKKKDLLSLMLFIGISSCLYAQHTDSIKSFPFVVMKEKTKTLSFVVKFQSVCCGVPNDSPLKKAINYFKKTNKLQKITATKIAPMGREGEYWIGFSLKELNRKQKSSFIRKMKTTTGKMKDKGYAACEENVKATIAELPSNIQFEEISF